MSGLKISGSLELGTDFVTKTCAILAQRRKGKTYTASVMAEELVAAALPFVALDPTGAWWGLRASADGAKAGVPVVILGGQHGDIPLERTGGKLVADLVVDQPGWYVIDFSLFESGAAERQFATDFAERLYRRKGMPDSDFPLHLFVDEADKFVPQRPGGGRGEARETDQRLLGAFEAIVRRGGLRGLGTTLISQRAAVVNKNVLEQIDMLITLRVVGPNDRKAIDEYLKADADDEQRLIMMGSLGSLELGEAWVWEPGGEPPLFDRMKIRERRTFNSSATPKPGQRRVEPKAFADVDLDAVKDAMAATVERAKENDPAELKRQLRDLQSELAEAKNAMPELLVERIEVKVPDEALVVRLEELLQPVLQVTAEIQEQLGWEVTETAAEDLLFRRRLRTTNRDTAERPIAKDPVPRAEHQRAARDASRKANVDLPGPQRKLLAVLATYGPRTKRQLALQAGYSENGGGFNNPLGALRSSGYVEKGSPITITEAGLDALGEYAPLPTGPELLEHWYAQLPGPATKILRALVEAGGALSKAELAVRAGYSPVGGGFNNPLGRLRTLGLVARGEPIDLTPEFVQAVQR